MEDVCAAAGWSSPSTFIKFHSLDVRMDPGSRVLSAWADAFLGLQLYKVYQALWYGVPQDMTSSQHRSEPKNGNIPVTYVTIVPRIGNEMLWWGPFRTFITLTSLSGFWCNSARHAYIVYGMYAWGAVPSAIWPMNWCDGIRASDIRHTIGVPPSDDIITASRSLLGELWLHL